MKWGHHFLCPKILNEIKSNLKYGQNVTVNLTENRNRVKSKLKFEAKYLTEFRNRVKNLRSNPFKSFGHWTYSIQEYYLLAPLSCHLNSLCICTNMVHIVYWEIQ